VTIAPARTTVSPRAADAWRGAANAARAMLANLPPHIAERELRVIQRRLGWDPSCLEVEVVGDAHGPGNVVILEIESEAGDGSVHRLRRARRPRRSRCRTGRWTRRRRYLAAGVPVGRQAGRSAARPDGVGTRRSLWTLAPTRHNEHEHRRHPPVHRRAHRCKPSAGRDDVRIEVAAP